MRQRLTIVVVLSAAVCCSRIAAAQTDSLSSILDQIRRDIAVYTATLPDLFCDERFTSSRVIAGHPAESHVTVSTFRILHTAAAPRRLGQSPESRTVREIDGAPAKGDHIKGPYTFNGGFDSALALLTLDRSVCFDLRLAPPGDPSRIHLTLAAQSPLPASCPATDLGRTADILVDAMSMQVLQIRQTLPHPPGGGPKWQPLTVTAIFAPVTLAGATFYTPASIHSQIFHSGSQEYLDSDATYTNYHKLEVTSKILPGLGDQP